MTVPKPRSFDGARDERLPMIGISKTRHWTSSAGQVLKKAALVPFENGLFVAVSNPENYAAVEPGPQVLARPLLLSGWPHHGMTYFLNYLAGNDCRYNHIASNSSSVIRVNLFHGMNLGSSRLP